MDIAESIDDVLTHFGKKGMKWGVRTNRDAEVGSKRMIRKQTETSFMLRTGITRKDFKDAKKDAKWHDKTFQANPALGRYSGKTNTKIYNDAIKAMKSDVKILNKKPEYSTRQAKKIIRKNKFDLDPSDPIAKKYNKEASNIYMKHIKASAPKHLTTSPSGKWETKLYIGKDTWSVAVKQVDGVKHASASDFDVMFSVRPIFDEEGYIINVEPVDSSMSQSSIIDDVLTHFGKKGMKWGVRNARTGPQSVTTRERGKKLKTSGGKGFPSHADAIRARKAGQIGKKSGVKALSNQELQEYGKRLHLEQQFKRIQYSQKNPGAKFVATLLGQTGKTQASALANDVAADQVKRHLRSRVIKTAAAAA